MVTVNFQGPDFNSERNPKGESSNDNGFALTIAGLNIDFNRITIVPQNMNEDLQIAISSPYMNEEGEECGNVAWRIEPEQKLLERVPELGPEVGKIFGFVNVS